MVCPIDQNKKENYFKKEKICISFFSQKLLDLPFIQFTLFLVYPYWYWSERSGQVCKLDFHFSIISPFFCEYWWNLILCFMSRNVSCWWLFYDGHSWIIDYYLCIKFCCRLQYSVHILERFTNRHIQDIKIFKVSPSKFNC